MKRFIDWLLSENPTKQQIIPPRKSITFPSPEKPDCGSEVVYPIKIAIIPKRSRVQPKYLKILIKNALFFFVNTSRIISIISPKLKK